MQGATPCLSYCPAGREFQSTHPCRVRLMIFANTTHSTSFNPRTRAGCDVSAIVNQPLNKFQSTHPCRVRRQSAAAQSAAATLFQSTHPCRVRQSLICFLLLISEFQSTHPCRVRPGFPCLTESWTARFNPRTRAGCDKSSLIEFFTIFCFNPRTRAGCDAKT